MPCSTGSNQGLTTRQCPLTREELPVRQSYDLSSVRHLAIGGAHVPPDLLDRVEKLARVRPVVSYGMTEAGGGNTVSAPDSKRGPVARPLPGVIVRTCDAEGKELPTRSRWGGLRSLPWMGVVSPWLATLASAISTSISVRLAQLVVSLGNVLGWEIPPLLPFRHPPAAFCRGLLVEKWPGGHD